MKKILCLAMSAIMCFSIIPAAAFAGVDSSSDILLNEENFPDENFRRMLCEKEFGEDGRITPEEIKTITTLDVMNQYEDNKIESVAGIEYFTFLKELNCDYNKITSIDLSKNLVLERLTCHDNKLTKLDCSNNYELKYILASSNELKEINVKNNPKLEYLYCEQNNLKEIDVSKNPKLLTFFCGANEISELDLSKNTELDSVSFPNNYVSEIDLSENEKLESLNCIANRLTSIDVTVCPELYGLLAHCNYFKNIDVSMQQHLHSFTWAPKEYSLRERENFDYSSVPTLKGLFEGYTTYYQIETEGVVLDKEKHTISLEAGKNLGKVRLKCEEDPYNEAEFIFYYGDGMKIDSCDFSGDESMIRIDDSTWKYVANGEPMDFNPVIKDKEGNVLENGKDYLITYSHRKTVNPGKYTMHIKGLYEYRGNKDITVVITPKPVTGLKVRHNTAKGGYDDAFLTWNKAAGASGYQVYARRPGKTSKWSSLGRTTKTSFLEKDLYDGWRYEFKVIPYVKRDDIRYRTTGDYSKTSLFTLKKAYRPSVKKYSSTRVKLTWKDIDGESGHQVMASRKGKTSYFRTSGKEMNLKVAKGKKYTYKVRAYKNVKKGSETVRVYAPWSDGRTYTLK